MWSMPRPSLAGRMPVAEEGFVRVAASLSSTGRGSRRSGNASCPGGRTPDGTVGPAFAIGPCRTALAPKWGRFRRVSRCVWSKRSSRTTRPWEGALARRHWCGPKTGPSSRGRAAPQPCRAMLLSRRRSRLGSRSTRRSPPASRAPGRLAVVGYIASPGVGS